MVSCLGQLCSLALLTHGFVCRLEDVSLARVDFALHAGYQHVGSAHLHRTFECRYQVAVIILMRDWMACVLERPRPSVHNVSSAVSAMLIEFVERDGLDGHWFLSVFHIVVEVFVMRCCSCTFCRS